MHTYKIKFLFSFLLFVFTFQAKAQFNFGVAYSLGYLNPKNDNSIINTFNEDRPWLEDELESINAIQGLHLSFRYRIDFVAFDLTLRNKFRSKKSSGIDPSTQETFDRNLTHRFLNYSIGIENFVGNISYGGSIEVENFAIRTGVTGVDDNFNITSQYGLASHFFISYNFDAGNSLDFAIRPYVHIPWQKYDITQSNVELNEGLASNQIEDRYVNFGIMLVFYNGSK